MYRNIAKLDHHRRKLINGSTNSCHNIHNATIHEGKDSKDTQQQQMAKTAKTMARTETMAKTRTKTTAKTMARTENGGTKADGKGTFSSIVKLYYYKDRDVCCLVQLIVNPNAWTPLPLIVRLWFALGHPSLEL